MSKKSKGIDRLLTFSRTTVTGGNPSGPLYKPPPGSRGSGWGGYSLAPCLQRGSMMEVWPLSDGLCLPLTLRATAIEALQPHRCPAGAVKAAEVLVGSWEIRNLHLLGVPG